MNSIKARFLSTLFILSMLVTAAPFALAFDEGMYMPDQIAKLPLKKLGFKISASDIYNPNGVGLSDAIVRLSIGCSAEFVSPEGLILTNHHCGFSALVTASTPEKDLVETGFDSKGRSGEIRAMEGKEPYTVQMTERSDDVTTRVLAGTESLTGEARDAAIEKNIAEITNAEQAKAPKGASIRIVPLNNGYFYYLIQTSELKDVRVVYAPPRNIGVFGGDPDNFEWTRHTGDFTFLRAYVAPDGTPADYSPNNVPYKPKKFLTMSPAGLKENDPVFVMGFPGGTTRYRESQSISYARDANFPFLEKWLIAMSDSLKKIGATDEEKRIKFQDKIANYDNSRKVYGGGWLRLKHANVVEQRKAEEAKLRDWIKADPARVKKYGGLLDEIATASAASNATQERDVMVRRFPNGLSMPVLTEIVKAMMTVRGGRTLTAEQKTGVEAGIKAALAEREPVFESDLIKFFLKSFDSLPKNERFAAADKFFAAPTEKERRAKEAAWADSIATGKYTDPANIIALYSKSWGDLEAEFPFLAGVVAEQRAAGARGQEFATHANHFRPLYMEALTEMKGGTVYPDANFTQRFSYGSIKGYQPREAEYRSPFTTIKGMIEKDTGTFPFDMPAKLKELQAAHDFGRYGQGDSVVVNFLSTTDIIGGNSGSPIMNKYGEQVGICFDGNFEGLGNDFYYDPNVNRTISVDIRFVLFVVDKFSGATYITNEMKFSDRRG
ncbi:MAG: S46 family peptidase [Acidobacteria bacterium]|nr:S46 family peptidase [Acidobacteriota bacterium]